MSGAITQQNVRYSQTPEASLGFKYCSKSPNGKRFVQGYKVLTLACAVYDIPLAIIVVTGRASEAKVLKDLYRKARRQFPWFKPKYLIADAAYDKKHVYKFLWNEGVEPIINITNTPNGKLRDGIYTKDGIPYLHGNGFRWTMSVQMKGMAFTCIAVRKAAATGLGR